MTEDFTHLKGFDRYTDIDITNKVHQSVIMFFDWGFLDKGAFTNVRLNRSDINSNNHSRLRLVNDPNYTNGQVWETFRNSLVWESGVSCDTKPISISGVYIDGTLRTPSDPVYGHYVDYERGRVVFSGAIPTTKSVYMEYSYKSICFGRESSYPAIRELQVNPNNQEYFFSSASGDWSTLLRRQCPLVVIEADNNINYEPYSLGTGAQDVNTTILMHIYDFNDTTVNKLASLISLQKEKTIYSIDFDLVAASGEYPLDYRGAKSSSPKTYVDFVNGNYRHAKIYFEDGIVTGNQPLANNIYHGTVKFVTQTIATV